MQFGDVPYMAMWVSFKLAGAKVRHPAYIMRRNFSQLTAVLRYTLISIQMIYHIFPNVQSTNRGWFETIHTS